MQEQIQHLREQLQQQLLEASQQLQQQLDQAKEQLRQLIERHGQALTDLYQSASQKHASDLRSTFAKQLTTTASDTQHISTQLMSSLREQAELQRKNLTDVSTALLAQTSQLCRDQATWQADNRAIREATQATLSQAQETLEVGLKQQLQQTITRMQEVQKMMEVAGADLAGIHQQSQMAKEAAQATSQAARSALSRATWLTATLSLCSLILLALSALGGWWVASSQYEIAKATASSVLLQEAAAYQAARNPQQTFQRETRIVDVPLNPQPRKK